MRAPGGTASASCSCAPSRGPATSAIGRSRKSSSKPRTRLRRSSADSVTSVERVAQLAVQAILRLDPIAPYRARGDLERLRGLLFSQPAEIAALDDECQPLVILCETGQRFVESDKHIRALIGAGDLGFVE